MISWMELTSKEHELNKGRQPTIHSIPISKSNPRIEQYRIMMRESVPYPLEISGLLCSLGGATTPGAAAALEKKSDEKIAS